MSDLAAPQTKKTIHPLNALRDAIKEINVEKGWWDPAHPKTFGDDIALITSELSEALEDFRAGHAPDALFYTRKVAAFIGSDQGVDPVASSVGVEVRCNKEDAGAKPCGIPSELADALIRILDLCAKGGIDIGAAVEEKLAFNRTRPHRHGGKKL